MAAYNWIRGYSERIGKSRIAEFRSGFSSGGISLFDTPQNPFLVGSLAIGESPVWPPSPVALISWLYVAIAGSLISYTAYMILLERTRPSLAASYTYVNPIVALVVGVTLGAEIVTTFEWCAAGAVLCGVVLLMRPSTSKA